MGERNGMGDPLRSHTSIITETGSYEPHRTALNRIGTALNPAEPHRAALPVICGTLLFGVSPSPFLARKKPGAKHPGIFDYFNVL